MLVGSRRNRCFSECSSTKKSKCLFCDILKTIFPKSDKI